MKYAFRLLLLCAAAVAGIAMSFLIISSTKSELRGLAHSFLFEVRRSGALEQRTQQVFRAMQAKQEIIDDLIAKRRTLREAFVGFRQADELIEEHRSNLMTPFLKVETDRELYEQILRWTQTKLPVDPSRAEEVRQRLEKEWAAWSRIEEREGQPPSQGGEYYQPAHECAPDELS